MSKARDLADLISAGNSLADGVIAITELSDVYTAMSPTDSQVLTYDTTNGWQAESIPTINTLNDIANVTITSAASGEVLSWNGSAWVNQALDDQLIDIAGLTPTVANAIVGDGTNFIATANSTDAIIVPAGTDAQRPGTPSNGMIRYSTTSSSFEGYQAGAWAAIGGSDVGAPTLSGSSSANEFSDTTVTITDYDSNLIYRVSVTGGSYTRTGGTITWTLPAVTTDTIHYMTVNAIDNGATSPDAEWDIDVLNIAFTGDTGIQITNFGSNTSNTGWAV